MSVKKEASGRRSVQVEVEVPGSKLGDCYRAGDFGGSRFFDRRRPSDPAGVAQAQEPPKPGKEHDHLKRLVGTWNAETESGKGTMTYKMGLGGLWLIGDFEGEFGGMKFQGKFLDTYDPATKKYRSISVDSFSTAPRIMEGNLDKDKKVMTMTGEGPGQEGRTAKFKSITEIKDADTVNFSLFMVDEDGKEQPTVRITYKRKN